MKSSGEIIHEALKRDREGTIAKITGGELGLVEALRLFADSRQGWCTEKIYQELQPDKTYNIKVVVDEMRLRNEAFGDGRKEPIEVLIKEEMSWVVASGIEVVSVKKNDD